MSPKPSPVLLEPGRLSQADALSHGPASPHPATYLPEAVAEAQQEDHVLLHVVAERLAEGLDQRGAH